jgi:hypothetical protein
MKFLSRTVVTSANYMKVAKKLRIKRLANMDQVAVVLVQ